MIAVTGATGSLGRLVIDELIELGVEPSNIVAAARSPEKASDLAESGVVVRHADYDDPATLSAALEGVDDLLLISGTDLGARVSQHQNVIDAAVSQGVGRIAYTSATKADTSGLALAADHRATERALSEAAAGGTILRNNWYYENYTRDISATLDQGAMLSATEGVSFNPAARADYAAAAAEVLTGDGHVGATYELAGPPLTYEDLAATISEVTGTEIEVVEMAPDAYHQTLVDAGLPPAVADMVVGGDRGIARGDLSIDSDDLGRLVGRPLVSFAEVVRAAL